MKNQLFSTVPDFEITTELLNYFGIQGFEDNHSFTKDNLQSLETVDKIVKIIDKLDLKQNEMTKTMRGNGFKKNTI